MLPRSSHFKLVDKTAVACSPEEWSFWFEFCPIEERTVARDDVGAFMVSTVFLGLDHNFTGGGPPLIFETMVFGPGGEGLEQERWSTWQEAEAGHAKYLAEMRARQPN